MTPHLHSLIKLLVLQGHTVRSIVQQAANAPDITGFEVEQEVSKIMINLTPEQAANIDRITEYLVAVNTIREKIKLQHQISNLLEQMSAAEKRLETLSNVKISV